MDLIMGLPRTTKEHDVIWVIVDRLTKIANFLSLKTTDTSGQLADLYIKEIIRLHGIPPSIVSDCATKSFSNYGMFFKLQWAQNCI